MGDLVGVVLAAGRGTRFAGGNKLLATLDGEPVVARAARTLAVDGVDHAVAVVGHDADAIRAAVSDLVDEVAYNPDYDRGQSASVRDGARVARERGADAVLFLPGDVPRVDGETVERLVAAHRDGDADATVPTYDGRRGNPVVFDAARFDDLLALSGDTGGRALFDDADVRRVPVSDPGVRADVDTAADLDALRQSDGDAGRS